jgi:predicted amidohydrolase
MRAAALQFDVRAGAVDENLRAVERGLLQAAERGVELVVLPEMWPTSFGIEGDAKDWLATSAQALERVRALSRELGLSIAGSALAPGRDGEAPRNRLTLFVRGERVLLYDKLHLFSPTAEPASFSSGSSEPPTVATPLGRIAGIVCYDLRFALALRAPFQAEAEILLVPAQWPAARATPWRALVCGRAAELQAFVIAANRTGTEVVARRRMELSFAGNSILAGPDGSIRAEGQGQDGLVCADFDLAEVAAMRRAIPVRRDFRGVARRQGIRQDRGEEENTEEGGGP